MLNQQIGSYKIKQLLGEGGMAIVYLAEKGSLGKKVALKVLKKEFLYNQNIRGRFLSEAKKMVQLNHPNIIGINDLLDQTDFVAIELEYIEGVTLKKYLEENGPLQDTVIEHLFRQMVSAVHYIHEKGFVHRDIKPSNFMLSSNNIIKLTDFGIAKNTNEGSNDYTQTGTLAILGTPKYMSPEQFISTKDVTAQSDIYSLGVVLWEMITRQSPYNIQSENWVEIFKKIENDSLPETNTRWDAIIKNATKKNTERTLVLPKSDWGENGSFNEVPKSHIPFIQIHEQIWMKENLSVRFFKNGDEIPLINSNKEWIETCERKLPACCIYFRDAENLKNHGLIYNWYAVMDKRGLAPDGWQIPKKGDWKKLSSSLSNNIELRAISTFFFTKLGGYRNYYGDFSLLDKHIGWWSATEINEQESVFSFIDFDSTTLNLGEGLKEAGYYVRCIKS